MQNKLPIAAVFTAFLLTPLAWGNTHIELTSDVSDSSTRLLARELMDSGPFLSKIRTVDVNKWTNNSRPAPIKTPGNR